MEGHVSLFRPIENPRYWKGLWAERWLKGTGNKPSDDTAYRVAKRIYVKDPKYTSNRKCKL